MANTEKDWKEGAGETCEEMVAKSEEENPLERLSGAATKRKKPPFNI